MDQKKQEIQGQGEKARAAKLQEDRLVTIGRLTSTIVHEINNPMQVIRGSMALALEELNDTQALETYLRLSQQESDRVVQLIALIRQIYRPDSDRPELLDIIQLLRNAYVITRDELNRQRVQFELAPGPEIPPIYAIANQLQLAFVNILLNISDCFGSGTSARFGHRHQFDGRRGCHPLRVQWPAAFRCGAGENRPSYRP